MSSESGETKLGRHWPTMLLGLLVAAVFLIAIFSFQVKSTDWAVVTTFGKITSVKTEGGLCFKWPYPIQNVILFDKRLRCFDGNVGKIEETFTKDGKNLLVGVYIIYRISDPAKFYQSVVTIPNAEDKLNTLMRTCKDGVVGQYDFSQIVNTDPQKIQLQEMEDKICRAMSSEAERQYGVSISSVGVKSIGLPESITDKVFERMITERKGAASEYRAEGKKIADTIRYDADKYKKEMITEAEAKAKSIRAEGDSEAASYYAVFKKNPDLAAFLRKLYSMKKIMSTKTTVILDTDCVPFDLLRTNADKVKGESAK